MRTIQVSSGFYKIVVGNKEFKLFAKDIRMISKRRKARTPPLPRFIDEDDVKDRLKGQANNTSSEVKS